MNENGEEQEPTPVSHNAESSSCVKGISRKEFLLRVVNRATVAGVLLVGCSEISQFKLIPPAYARFGN